MPVAAIKYWNRMTYNLFHVCVLALLPPCLLGCSAGLEPLSVASTDFKVSANAENVPMEIEILSIAGIDGNELSVHGRGWVMISLTVDDSEANAMPSYMSDTIVLHGKPHESSPSYASRSWGAISSHATLTLRYVSDEGEVVIQQELSPPDSLVETGHGCRHVLLKRVVLAPEVPGEYSVEIELTFSSLREALSTHGDWLDDQSVERWLQQKISTRVEGVLVVAGID